MVPNGHSATYSFFASIIRLGLYRARPGITNQINRFLYNWQPNVKRDKDKKGKKADGKIPKANK